MVLTGGVRAPGLSRAVSHVASEPAGLFMLAAIALGAVLLLGILQGILIAALASIVMLLARVSRPHVAFLGRVPGTNTYSDLTRHPEKPTLCLA